MLHPLAIRCLVPVVLLATACQVDLSLPDATAVECQSNGDCPPGLDCSATLGTCVDRTADASPPGVLDGSVLIEPPVVGLGKLLQVDLDVSEVLARPPTVAVASGETLLGNLELVAASGSHYTFARVTSGLEPEETVSLVASLVDQHGNVAEGVALGTVRFDFSAPVVSALRIDGGALLRVGASTRVRFSLNETPAAPPSVELDGVGTWTPESASGSELSYLWTATGDEGAGPFDVTVRVIDGADNAADARLPAAVGFDFAAPTLVTSAFTSPTQPGQQLFVSISVSEPLALPPSVQLVGAGDPLTMLLRDSGQKDFVFVVTPAASAEGAHDVQLGALLDAAGNIAAPQSLGPLTVDGTPPALSGPADITPTLLTADTELSVSFDLDEPVVGLPELLVDGVPFQSCSDVGGGTSFSCTYTPSLSEGSGVRRLVANVVDGAGNLGVLTLGTATFDMDGPLVVGATLVRTPGLAEAVDAATDTTYFSSVDPFTGEAVQARLVLFADETPSAPSLTIQGPDTLVLPLLGITGKQVVFAGPVGTPADGSYTFSVSWQDALGNTVSRDLETPILVVDSATPAAADVQNIVYERAPWGWDDDLPIFALHGLGAAPGATRVIAYRNATPVAANVVGTALVSNGDFDIPVLSGGDLPTVYIATVSRAGVPAAPVPAVNVVWRATLRGKVPGSFAENPHRLLQSSRFVPVLRDDAAGEAGAGPNVTRSSAASWRRVESQAAPSLSRIAYDTNRGQLVVWDHARAQIARWRGAVWSETVMADPENDGNPSTGSVGFDIARDELVVTTPASGTWVSKGTSWRQAATAGATPATANAPMVFDANLGMVVAAQGCQSSCAEIPNFEPRFWAWDGTAWQDTTPAGTEGLDYPFRRNASAVAFDPVRRRLVLWGGNLNSSGAVGCPVGASNPGINNCFMYDTWEWDGATWSRVIPVDGGAAPADGEPQPGSAQGATYDAARGKVVLLASNGLWGWNGVSWDSIAANDDAGDGGPGYASGLVYDLGRKRLLLAESFSGDRLWEERSGDWVLVSPGDPEADGDPAPRYGGRVTYDSGRKRFVTFGGRLSSGSSCDGVSGVMCLGWEWTGHRWLRIGAAGPVGRYVAGLAYSSAGASTVLFGGRLLTGTCEGSGSGTCGSTWLWNGTAWDRRCDGSPGGDTCGGTQPSARSEVMMAYDVQRGVVVLFGGAPTNNETWEWNNTAFTWTRRCDGVPAGDTCGTLPSARYAGAMAYDSDNHWMVLFGGSNGSDLGDTWRYDGSTWLQLASGGIGMPSARSYSAMVYDRGRRRMLLYRGSGVPDETLWQWDGATWSAAPAGDLELDGNPGSRWWHDLAYDSDRGTSLMFSGIGAVVGNDAWVLDGGAAIGPGQEVLFSFANARPDQGASGYLIDDVQLEWTVGATGGPASGGCGTSSGADLAVWYDGTWLPLSAPAAGAEAPQLATWSAASEPLLAVFGPDFGTHLLADAGSTFAFSATPAHTTGCAASPAAIRTDDVRLTVSYQRF